MKKIIPIVVSIVIVSAILYFYAAFVMADFDFRNWGPNIRYGFSLISIILNLGVTLVLTFEKAPKNTTEYERF